MGNTSNNVELSALGAQVQEVMNALQRQQQQWQQQQQQYQQPPQPRAQEAAGGQQAAPDPFGKKDPWAESRSAAAAAAQAPHINMASPTRGGRPASVTSSADQKTMFDDKTAMVPATQLGGWH